MAKIFKSVPVVGTYKVRYQKETAFANKTKKSEQKNKIDKAPATKRDFSDVEKNSISEIQGQKAITDKVAAEESQDKRKNYSADGRLLNDLRSSVERYKKEIEELQVKYQNLQDNLAEQEAAAKKKGYTEGYEEGLSEGKQELIAKLNELKNLYSVFSGEVKAQERAIIAAAKDIGVEIFSNLIGSCYKDAEFIEALVQRSVEKVSKGNIYCVYLSKKDYELITEITDGKKWGDVKMVPDPRVDVGGCIIETENGNWDARIEVQLERILSSLRQAQ